MTTEIIEPVHQLWPLPGDNQRTQIDVVFFHGLQFNASGYDTLQTAWTQREHDDICWPQDWLPFDLDHKVRVLCIQYDTHMNTSSYDSVLEIAHNLFGILINGNKWNVGQDCHVVLVGHSFGGLVLKNLVVEAWRQTHNSTNHLEKHDVKSAKTFLKNLRGVAFYAVPQAGSNHKKILRRLFDPKGLSQVGIMNNMNDFQRKIKTLAMDFEDIAKTNGINVYAFYEGRATNDMGILVDSSPAQQSSMHNFYILEDCDHMQVCKPPSKKHPSYLLLLRLINTIIEEANASKKVVFPRSPPIITFRQDKHVANLKELLEKVHVIGIVDMGGVGKTTLARQVFDTICNDYDACSILVDVRSRPSEEIERQLLDDLGWKQKVLVIIDDMDYTCVKSISSFFKSRTFANGSNFILLSHDREAIKDLVGKEGKIQMEFLDHSLGNNDLLEESFASNHSMEVSLDSDYSVEEMWSDPLGITWDAYASELELQEMIAKGDQEGILRIDESELELGEILAKGAQACIYLAMWKPMSLLVVVKTFMPLKQIVLQLQKIIKMLMILQSRSNAGGEICGIKGMSIVNTKPAIVMEQMAGDLRSFIDFQMINVNDMNMSMLFPHCANIAMMMGIAKGMKDLHSCGLVHRDLKSSNVLLAPKKGWMDLGFLKIADFEMEGVLGTGFWRAPEVLNALKHGENVDNATFTTKVDVYAFAMVCYEILTGHTPFYGHPLSDYDLVLSGERPPLPSCVNDKLQRLVSSCWVFDPKIRPEFVEIVKILEDEYGKLLNDQKEAQQQNEEFKTNVEKWSTQGRTFCKTMGLSHVHKGNGDTHQAIRGQL